MITVAFLVASVTSGSTLAVLEPLGLGVGGKQVDVVVVVGIGGGGLGLDCILVAGGAVAGP